MDRREFIKSSIPVVALTNTRLGGLLFGRESQKDQQDVFDAYDLIICGGTLAGCFSALHAARRGLRVLLIERRTFLGTEITATLRPWLHREGFDAFTGAMKKLFLPDEEKPEVDVPFELHHSREIYGDDVPLFCGSVKKQFMKALMSNGVDVLLMTGVWGPVTDRAGKMASGVVVANKSGHQIVRGKNIIDTSGSLSPSQDRAKQSRSFSLELFDVDDSVERKVSIPASIGLVGNRIHLHKGKRAAGQYFVEFQFVPSQNDVEHEARMKTESLCEHLRKNHSAFSQSRVNQMAWETVELRETKRAAVRKELYENCYTINPANVPTLSCQDIIDVDGKASDIVNRLHLETTGLDKEEVIRLRSGQIPMTACQTAPLDDVKLNYAIKKIAFPYKRYLQNSLRADVVVAGGGTAGAMAAMGAIEKGAHVITVEYFPELGGTKTLGGVAGWYAGYRNTELFKIAEQGFRQQEAAFSNKGGSKIPRMMSYFRKQATADGGRLLANSIISGVIMEGKKATGIVVEREGILSIVTGDVIIDATGDADVAAFAGASYDFGNRRMEATQNYSQWDVNPRENPPMPSCDRRDYDILMNHYLSDFQRGYRLTHLQSHYYDFLPMLTVRESRRIRGEHTITVRDILQQRHYPDVICLAHTNFDPHTFGDTALTRVGCLLVFAVSATPQIPYRAIIPKGIDGMLISGKAISQTHNALQFTRMSFDIMTLGYVTGRIAATVARERIGVRDFDAKSIQQDMIDLKILRPEDLARSEDSSSLKYAEDRVEELVAGKKHSLLQVLLLPGDRVGPILRRRYTAAADENEKRRLAKALAWLGDARGNKYLLDEMEALRTKEIEAGQLPREHQPEDRGTPYWPINQDIALLGLSGDRTALPAILKIADSLQLNNPPVQHGNAYKDGRIDWCLIPYYNRMINVCFAVEHMPDAIAVDSLNRFLSDPYICGNVTREAKMATENVFPAILESRIAATLARCGAKRGFDILVEYLGDMHYLLAQYARQELRSILSKDYGHDTRRWKQYVDSLTFPTRLAARPKEGVEL